MNARRPGGLPRVCVAWLLVAPRVFRAPEGPAAREARRPHFVRRRASKPARALRTLRRPPHQWGLWRCVLPGQAPPPPTGTVAGPSGALRTSGARLLMCGSARRLNARPGPLPLSNFARNSPATISNSEFRSLELQRFQTLLNVHPIELRATFLGAWPHRPSNFACNSLGCVSWFEV